MNKWAKKQRHGKLKEHVDEIIEMYKKGLSTVKIAEEFGVNKTSIQRLLKKYDIKLTPNKYRFNHDYFEVIDSEHKAYWLGFLYADGMVTANRNTISLRIHENDGYILNELVKDLDSNLPVNTYETKGNKSPTGKDLPPYHYSSVDINSPKMKQDLIDKGCIPNKSLVLTFPELPQHLVKHFIRGYLDGDGCITTLTPQKNGTKNFKVTFCGTEEFLTGIVDYINENLFEKKCILYKRHNDNKNNYSLEFGGNQKVYTLLNHLYELSTIHLTRKHERYEELVNSRPL